MMGIWESSQVIVGKKIGSPDDPVPLSKAQRIIHRCIFLVDRTSPLGYIYVLNNTFGAPYDPRSSIHIVRLSMKNTCE